MRLLHKANQAHLSPSATGLRGVLTRHRVEREREREGGREGEKKRQEGQRDGKRDWQEKGSGVGRRKRDRRKEECIGDREMVVQRLREKASVREQRTLPKNLSLPFR